VTVTAPQLPYTFRVTKYDPADRDERGRYVGVETATSDHGRGEAAHLAAVAAFADETGVQRLEIREPQIAGFVNFGLEAPLDGHGLTGLFPSDLSGYHDGAQVPVAVGLELVRAMLRDNGAWCLLEAEDRFFIHVGYDQYVYVGSTDPCEYAQDRTRALGLFAERIDASPYEPHVDQPGPQRPADDDFWLQLYLTVPRHEAMLLEESHVQNAARWHRITHDNLDSVRARLAPRARLTVWPDLSTDLDAVRDSVPNEGLIELVWEDNTGKISSVIADEDQYGELTGLLGDARAAAALPMTVDDRHPLLAAVLPDSDGVLRARWRTDPTPSDTRWRILNSLQRGQTYTGTVTTITNFGAFVDLGGIEGMINVAELSWAHLDHPSDIVDPGQEVTVEILDIDIARERVALSLKATQEDPWLRFPYAVGQMVTGPITKLVPFGAFVRLTDSIEGLVHNTELAEQNIDHPEQVVQVDDEIHVKILEIDHDRRRISLSHKQARREP
jgi:small subunit ribosomal protein S1